MHISEGVLAVGPLAAGWAVTAIGLAVGLKRLDEKQLVTASFLAAAFFVASLIHVPLGPGNVHLVLNGVLAAMLGWSVFPAIFVSLLLQAVLFQYGGLTILGVNTATMSLSGLLCWLLLRPWLAKGGRARMVAAFLMGFGSVGVAALLTSLCLALSGEALVPTASLLLLAHVPVMCIEGAITVAVVQFLARVQPELLHLTAPGPTPVVAAPHPSVAGRL
ncbi:cobalt transporter CbiM [Megalodesulfovibrio paquesii]